MGSETGWTLTVPLPVWRTLRSRIHGGEGRKKERSDKNPRNKNGTVRKEVRKRDAGWSVHKSSLCGAKADSKHEIEQRRQERPETTLGEISHG